LNDDSGERLLLLEILKRINNSNASRSEMGRDESKLKRKKEKEEK
jgi:hypothetical protein